MGVPEIFHSVAIIVFVKVVLNSVRVKIAWPDELVYPTVIVVVLIKRVSAREAATAWKWCGSLASAARLDIS